MAEIPIALEKSLQDFVQLIKRRTDWLGIIYLSEALEEKQITLFHEPQILWVEDSALRQKNHIEMLSQETDVSQYFWDGFTPPDKRVAQVFFILKEKTELAPFQSWLTWLAPESIKLAVPNQNTKLWSISTFKGKPDLKRPISNFGSYGKQRLSFLPLTLNRFFPLPDFSDAQRFLLSYFPRNSRFISFLIFQETGLWAPLVAYKFPNAYITCVDDSHRELQSAQQTFILKEWKKRGSFVWSSSFDELDKKKFDLILLPYQTRVTIPEYENLLEPQGEIWIVTPRDISIESYFSKGIKCSILGESDNFKLLKGVRT